jgi:ATP-dependent DNA ligase
VTLPFKGPIEPMLSKLSPQLPAGDDWIFEPKWDGFRALIFKDGDAITIQSRDLKPLGRYFPELEAPLREQLPERIVLDGEVVIVIGGRLDFDAMLMRIHPAKSRVAMLAEQAPASYVTWDVLAIGDEDLRALPQLERRARLEAALAAVRPPIHVSPMTRDRAVATDWFERFEGAGLDGVMAKPVGLTYTPGKRLMLKIKHARTADCVAAGFRWYKDSRDKAIGSLLLGLFDDKGVLHHVGVTAAFKASEREKLVTELAPLREGARENHPWKDWADWQDAADADPTRRVPGAKSRWNRGKDLSWEPLRIERVCEVGYDHMQGTRFRHGTHFKRWRFDKRPEDCRYDQLEETPAQELAQIFGRS